MRELLLLDAVDGAADYGSAAIALLLKLQHATHKYHGVSLGTAHATSIHQEDISARVGRSLNCPEWAGRHLRTSSSGYRHTATIVKFRVLQQGVTHRLAISFAFIQFQIGLSGA